MNLNNTLNSLDLKRQKIFERLKLLDKVLYNVIPSSKGLELYIFE